MPKEFDLQKAIDGHPLVTRDGKEVTEFHFFTTCKTDYPCIAIINGEKTSFAKNGGYSTTCFHPNDLFLASKKREAWVNVYKSPSGNLYTDCNTHESKQLAYKHRNVKHYIDSVKIHERKE